MSLHMFNDNYNCRSADTQFLPNTTKRPDEKASPHKATPHHST